MERYRLRQLLVDYANGTITATDMETLLDHVARYRKGDDLDDLLQELLESTPADMDVPTDSEILYQRIVQHPRFGHRRRRWRNYWWYSAAAVLVIAGGWFFADIGGSGDKNSTPLIAEITRTVTSAPTERPILQLSDGKIIDLGQAVNGVLAVEDGTLVKFDGLTLSYEGKPANEDGQLRKHRIITPKGHQYHVLLQDGSEIWVNAATELVYPVRFDRHKREVSVIGEAYFEVEKAMDWPFVVKTGMQEIEVLGTHFNVSAYEDDERSSTTLLEGQVRVSAVENQDASAPTNRRSTVLKPGQQAVTKKGGSGISVSPVDTEEVVAWRDNLFVFNNEEISEVMKAVSRWYDVEVEYLDGMAGKRIGGSIPRFDQVEQMMDALQATGLLHYKMKGGVIVVMK
ncbi:FecR family protein [Parapedobacter luteus]|uniref:FecR family protein n=1 Tax=Parapedobacter luteus TaxID=623280 RepID=A0A1T5AFZ7_9SPHI|nr:FecR domain-containing protein [Parapedobacter luteus]SKB33931.1 FecR family protein [Parapedobacter luteus]